MRFSAFSSKTIISECAWIDFSRRPKIASLQAKVHAKNALSGRPFGRFSNLINKGQNSPESGTRGFSRPLITNIMFKLTSEHLVHLDLTINVISGSFPDTIKQGQPKIISGGFLARRIQIWHRRAPHWHLVHRNPG